MEEKSKKEEAYAITRRNILTAVFYALVTFASSDVISKWSHFWALVVVALGIGLLYLFNLIHSSRSARWQRNYAALSRVTEDSIASTKVCLVVIAKMADKMGIPAQTVVEATQQLQERVVALENDFKEFPKPEISYFGENL